MKKELFAASILGTSFLLTIFLIFSFGGVTGYSTTVNFTVNLSISGNANPSIAWVESGLSANPIELSGKTVYILFNASDANGYADLDYTTAQVILTQDGEQQRVGSCQAFNNDSLIMQLNCTVTLQYYDKDGNWQINASIDDLSVAHTEDFAQTFNYGSLQAVQGNVNGIMFGDVTLGNPAQATNDPLVLDNTGNQNFTEINLTAYSLVGQSNPSQIIDANNFYANISQNNFGDQLANNTAKKLSNGTLPRDIGGSSYSRNMYFWVSVPSAGLSNQNYTSSSPWKIEVFP